MNRDLRIDEALDVLWELLGVDSCELVQRCTGDKARRESPAAAFHAGYLKHFGHTYACLFYQSKVMRLVEDISGRLLVIEDLHNPVSIAIVHLVVAPGQFHLAIREFHYFPSLLYYAS